MTRDELRGIVEGISDEQLKKILDLNSSDIGKAKTRSDELERLLNNAEEKLSAANEQIEAYEGRQREAEEVKTKMEELQKIVDNYEAQNAQRKVENRFKNVTRDVKFLNDFTRAGVFEEFSRAVAEEKNEGKSDDEIFAELLGDREDILVPQGGIPSVVASTMGFGGNISDSDVREIMGLSAN